MAKQSFDFIVVGAGSAGAVVAARLSEDRKDNVLCLKGGGNLRDRWSPVMKYRITRQKVTVGDIGHGWRSIIEGMKYVFLRLGLIASSAAAVLVFLRTRKDLKLPDALISISPVIAKRVNAKRVIEKIPGIRMNVNVPRPKDTGRNHLRSVDPSGPPRVQFNFNATEGDRRTLIGAMLKNRELMAPEPMTSIVADEMAPGLNKQSDEDLHDRVQKTAATTFHPVVICKIGSDPMAVMDEHLKVHCMQGLRISDASIMPTMISDNTNAPTSMIGEKCAAMILEEAEGTQVAG